MPKTFDISFGYWFTIWSSAATCFDAIPTAKPSQRNVGYNKKKNGRSFRWSQREWFIINMQSKNALKNRQSINWMLTLYCNCIRKNATFCFFYIFTFFFFVTSVALFINVIKTVLKFIFIMSRSREVEICNHNFVFLFSFFLIFFVFYILVSVFRLSGCGCGSGSGRAVNVI